MRDKDISGVSGEGIVAEGVEFENGMCALSFYGPHGHINVYQNIRAVSDVHGHGGATHIIFLDADPSMDKEQSKVLKA